MFFQPWGFLLLGGVGLLAAIYFLQRRFRSRQVSSLMLWRLPRLPQQGGRNWRRLRTPPPFWLELLLIVLLALAAAAPHFKLSENRRPLAVVLDDSFSMTAGSPPTPGQQASADGWRSDSPRALAVEALVEELGQGRHAPVHLVLAGREASLLAQGLRGEEQVLQALRGWKCQSASADLISAVALARRLAGNLGRVLVLSDHLPGGSGPAAASDGAGGSSDVEGGSDPEETSQPQEEVSPLAGPGQETRAGASQYVQWSFGRPRLNLALVNAGRSSASSRNIVEVANLGDRTQRTALTIETLTGPGFAGQADAQESEVSGDALPQSASPEEAGAGDGSRPSQSAADGSASGGPQATVLDVSQRTLDLGPGETRRLVFQANRRRPLRLSLPPDALQSDNQALLLPENRPPVRAALRIEEPMLNTLLRRALEATGQARLVEDRPEIIFTSRLEPEEETQPAQAWRFRLLSQSGAPPQAGPFVVDRTHPLGQGLNLSAVLWAASPSSLPGTPVILADDIPLLSYRPALDGGMDLWMRLHPPASNVQRTADWPILIHNLLGWRQDQRPGPRRANLRSGEEAGVRLDDASQVTVRLPDGTRRTLSPTAGEISLSAVHPGLYRLQSAAGPSYVLSANVLHPGESELRRAASGRWGRWIDEAARRWEFADLTWIPLLAALLVLLLHQLLTGGHLDSLTGPGGGPSPARPRGGGS